MKHSRIIIILLLSFLINGTLYAANWEFVTTSEKQDTYYYIDTSDIEINNNTVIFWVKGENIDPFKHNGLKTWTTKFEYQIKNNFYRGSQRVFYYENGNSENSFQSDKWNQLPPFASITFLTGAAIYMALENKEWISVDDNNAFFQPKWSNNELFFWDKYNYNGEIFFAFQSYRPITNESKGYVLVSKSSNNEQFKYSYSLITYNSYYPLNPESPIAKVINRAMDFSLGK